MQQNHNKLLDEIKNKKEEINALRRERVIFDNVFKDLEKDLKNKELDFKKTLYEYVQIHHEKELAQEELEKIREESEKEMKIFSNNFGKVFQSTDDDEKDDILFDENAKKSMKIVYFHLFIVNEFF